jgi:Zn-finger nucleic acid-binding protein
MVKFQVTCPECRAAVVTAHPEALVWERCPGCRRHIWDRYDALMAEEVRPDTDRRRVTGPMIN